MRNVLAIDPGTLESGYCVLRDDYRLVEHGIVPNKEMEQTIVRIGQKNAFISDAAIEMVASYGMPVGKEVFETVVQIGRFERLCDDAWINVHRIPRLKVKMHLCHKANAKDPNVNQAIRDLLCERHGLIEKQLKGTKKAPGPIYGVKSHIWAALGLAIYVLETQAA